MKRRILVVEDDRTLRQALTFNLAREDYEVRVAVDGEQALAAGRDPTLDLILLDVMLPGHERPRGAARDFAARGSPRR